MSSTVRAIPMMLLLATACTDRPKAPPLTDEAVFQDDRIGLRFLVPAGWSMQSRAVVPPGPLQRTVVVVSYQRPPGPRPATFEVLAIDRPADDNLERALAEHGTGNAKWVPHPPARQLTLNGTEATQFVLVSAAGKKDEGRREATAFRRGDRVYFFVLTYSAADPDVRDAVRSTLESITWTK
jgi:hypothetical protein